MLHIDFRPHRTSLTAGTTSPQKVFAMLKVIPDEEATRARPSLAFAFVVDTSGSMYDPAERGSSRTKLEQAMQAAHQLVDDDRLLSTDQVAVIQFSDRARQLLPLTPLAQKDGIHAAITSLRKFSGGTRLAKGLEEAQLAFRTLQSHAVTRVLTLTDGETQDERRCRSLAKAFGDANMPIIGLGIGHSYNERLLLEMASSSQGRAYHLSDMAHISTYLDREAKMSVKEVVTDVQATVTTVRGTTFVSLTRVYPNLSDIALDQMPYRLGNLAAGDFTVYSLEFAVGGIARPPSRARVAQLTLTAHGASTGQSQSLPPLDLFVNFTEDTAAVAVVDPEVLGYVQQKNVDQLIQDAMRQSGQPQKAREALITAIGLTQNVGNPGMTRMLTSAIEELDATGSISADTVKTVRVGGRTMTVRSDAPSTSAPRPSDEMIHKATGL